MSPEAPPERPDVLDSVRAAAALVADRSRSVLLVPERVGPYARELLAEGVLDPARSLLPGPWRQPRAHPEVVAGRVIGLATINFGSGWHPVVRKRPGQSGATTMAAGLGQWMAIDGVVRAERLARLDTERMHVILDQPHDDGPVDELMGLFTTALNDLGHLVLDRYDSSFLVMVGAADHSAAALVEVLATMPFYRDVSTYDGVEVPLYKRAQLVAADLHRATGGDGIGRFDDQDRLTAFADNLVPHVLRVDGVLGYGDELLARIDRGELLVAGSPEEVEIRALGVHAVEAVRAELAELGHDVPSWRLDQVLWERGGRARYKALPRHRARSVFY